MTSTPREDLIRRLDSLHYAKLYGAESAKVDFAVTLVRARRAAPLTQKELAERLGVSQAYIAKLEGGEANPTLGTIGSLLATLGRRLVTDTDDLRPEPTPAAPIPIQASASEEGSFIYFGELSDRSKTLSFQVGSSLKFLSYEEPSSESAAAGQERSIAGAHV